MTEKGVFPTFYETVKIVPDENKYRITPIYSWTSKFTLILKVLGRGSIKTERRTKIWH